MRKIIPFFFALCAFPAFGATETVTCKVSGASTGVGHAYKLTIDWAKETADIAEKPASQTGVAVWKPLFTKATVVRNSATDKALLAEGTVKQWSGEFTTTKAGKSCGGMVEELFFDLRAEGGKRVGTVEKNQRYAKDPKAGTSCRANYPAPETISDVVNVTCQ